MDKKKVQLLSANSSNIDRIMVMNKSEIVELDTAESIYTNPQQPYIQKKLISAIPKALVLQ